MKKNPHQPHRAPKMPCELEVVHKPSREVTFLDSRITVDLRRGVIFTDVYDKRKDMVVYRDARTFPHRESLLPRAVPFNVITGQFIRFGRRISCFNDFLRATSDLVARMLNHGYDERLVRAKVKGFGRYWFRYCSHLGRFRHFDEAFPSHVRRRCRQLAAAPNPAPAPTPAPPAAIPPPPPATLPPPPPTLPPPPLPPIDLRDDDPWDLDRFLTDTRATAARRDAPYEFNLNDQGPV